MESGERPMRNRFSLCHTHTHRPVEMGARQEGEALGQTFPHTISCPPRGRPNTGRTRRQPIVVPRAAASAARMPRMALAQQPLSDGETAMWGGVAALGRMGKAKLHAGRQSKSVGVCAFFSLFSFFYLILFLALFGSALSARHSSTRGRASTACSAEPGPGGGG